MSWARPKYSWKSDLAEKSYFIIGPFNPQISQITQITMNAGRRSQNRPDLIFHSLLGWDRICHSLILRGLPLGSLSNLEYGEEITMNEWVCKGISQVARDAGLSRESLYKALSGERSPNFTNLP
jgi:hypothetical protein